MPKPATRATPLQDLIRLYLTTPTSAVTIAEETGKTRTNVQHAIARWRKADPENAPRIAAWERGSGGKHTPLYAIGPKWKRDAKPLKRLPRSEVQRRWKARHLAEVRISERSKRTQPTTPTWLLPLIFSQSALVAPLAT